MPPSNYDVNTSMVSLYKLKSIELSQLNCARGEGRKGYIVAMFAPHAGVCVPAYVMLFILQPGLPSHYVTAKLTISHLHFGTVP
ncbi:hypothetical protein J6590_047405 [Homalodisca vitripennis]|nr:hypothetical protein J6590_047405 [Homalodisca vitripennis]